MNVKSKITAIAVAAILVTAAFLLGACGGIKIDSELMNALKAVKANCRVDEKNGLAKKCKNDGYKKLLKMLDTKDAEKTLPTLTVAFGGDDAILSALAANMMHMRVIHKMGKIEKNPQLVSDRVADENIHIQRFMLDEMNPRSVLSV